MADNSVRVGIGYDVHGFAEPSAGRALILGGVTIPYERGLAGHSDADVLIHALVDALLGATALGDIGTHFPSSDPRWKDAPSTGFPDLYAPALGRAWLACGECGRDRGGRAAEAHAARSGDARVAGAGDGRGDRAHQCEGEDDGSVGVYRQG